jgi:very-short-patch-repair endonuclease
VCGIDIDMLRQLHTQASDSALCGATPAGAAAGTRSAASARQVAALARRQHGVITRPQLIELGMKPRAIDRRVAAERLTALHRGVYLVGPVQPPLAREVAAVLACGRGAALSHGSAVWLWGLRPGLRGPARVEVIVAGREPGTRAGVALHRVRTLGRDEITTRDRIPVTTPARTLLDFAATAGAAELEGALAEAHARNLARRSGLAALLARHTRHRGARRLRALLDADLPPARVRSSPERRLLAVIRRARLPPPEVNALLGDHEVDLLWRAERVAVEVDGFAYHSSTRAFERDHRREVDLAAAGFQLVRISARQIAAEPEAALVAIARALASR